MYSYHTLADQGLNDNVQHDCNEEKDPFPCFQSVCPIMVFTDAVDSLLCGCLNSILAFHSITVYDTISFISDHTKKTAGYLAWAYSYDIGRVRTGPGNPGKSLNLKTKNPGLESPGILLKVLESPGILNNKKRDCKNSICSSLIIK